MNINLSGNIALDNILFARDGKLVTLLDSSVTPDQALQNLKTNNLMGLDTRINLLGFGKFTKNHKNFWSFDVNIRANESMNLPKSLFEFLKRGQEGSIKNFGTAIESYLEAGFNYSFPLLTTGSTWVSEASSSQESPAHRSTTTSSTSRSSRTAGPWSRREPST